MKLWMNAKHECAQIYNTAMRTCVRGGANEFNFSKKKKFYGANDLLLSIRTVFRVVLLPLEKYPLQRNNQEWVLHQIAATYPGQE